MTEGDCERVNGKKELTKHLLRYIFWQINFLEREYMEIEDVEIDTVKTIYIRAYSLGSLPSGMHFSFKTNRESRNEKRLQNEMKANE